MDDNAKTRRTGVPTQQNYNVTTAVSPSKNPQKRGCNGCFSTMMIASILLLAVLVFGGVVAAGTVVYSNLKTEIDEGIAKLDGARERETFETTQIFDRNGELLWEIFGEGKRTNIPFEQLPPELIYATISVEDDSFYENVGADIPSLIAALIANAKNPNGRPVGASTITQQLVRNIVFDYEERTAVSYNRKAKELILAWMMNQDYSKNEILSMYLNEIYYGNLAYGIEAAAQTYFEKTTADLTLGEASLLAGLPQSPIQLDPLTNLEGAKERQWLVLNLMVNDGRINEEQAVAAYQEPLPFVAQEVSLAAPHFSVYVRQQLEEMFGAEEVANGGLRVTTSLDLGYQQLAEQLARQHINALDPAYNLTNASLVALKPDTGEILAMLGSVDYQDEGIDGYVNVALSPQQPGSAIKPLTYAAALSPNDGQEPAWTAADILWDVPVEYAQVNGSTYTPVNYDGAFRGPVRLRAALANSYNIPALLTLQDLGVPRLLEFAQQMGINSWGNDPANYGLSLTLGGAEVTPLELTSAYAVFANGGKAVSPVSILRVEKSDGELLFVQETAVPLQILDARVAYLISDILDDDLARLPAMGRNNPLELPFPAAAKTGTTNDFRDNWTVGYTPGLVVGVWTGNTDNSEMLGISGLTGAAPLWGDYMQAVYANYDLLDRLWVDGIPPATTFEPPEGLEKRPLCNLTTITIGATECAPAGEEWFLVRSDLVAGPELDPSLVKWVPLEPAVIRAPAVPLAPLPVEAQQVSDSDNAPPPQLFCQFSEGTAVATLPPAAAEQLFLAPPRNEESLPAAHQWAQANNLPILPTQTCNEELLALAGDPNRVAFWRIVSPADGEVVTGILPIVGTADFDPQDVQFYKLELGMPNGENVDWLTLGETHDTPVVNGTLETLYAQGLPPGQYFLRLIVVQDSNYVGEPHMISFVVES